MVVTWRIEFFLHSVYPIKRLDKDWMIEHLFWNNSINAVLEKYLSKINHEQLNAELILTIDQDLSKFHCWISHVYNGNVFLSVIKAHSLTHPHSISLTHSVALSLDRSLTHCVGLPNVRLSDPASAYPNVEQYVMYDVTILFYTFPGNRAQQVAKVVINHNINCKA